MLKYFIESRKPYRPWTNTAESLRRQADTSLIVAQEVQYGLYNPLPPSFHNIIDPNKYYEYRSQTRTLFGEAFDAPPFSTFFALADYFDASIQELAKCLCIQRSLMQNWDRQIQLNKRPHNQEITEAMLYTFGPEYTYRYVLGQPSITPPSSPTTSP